MITRKIRTGFTIAVVGVAVLGASGNAGAQQTPIDVLQQFVRSQSQQAVAVAIGTLCPPGNRLSDRLQQDCNALVGAAFGGDGAVRAAFEQIAPDNVNASIDRSLLSGATLTQGGFGFSGGPSLSGTGNGEGGLSLSLLPDLSGARYAASSDFGRWSVFAHLDFADYGRDTSSNEDGFDADRQAITVGIDRRFSDRLNAGIALGLGRSDLEFDANSGGQDIDEQRLLAYLNWSGASGLYLDALASLQRRSTDQVRRVAYTLGSGVSVDQRFAADFDGDVSSLALTLGRQWQRDAMSIDPYLGLEFTSIDADGYQERASAPDAAGAGWAIIAPDIDSDLSVANLGLRLNWSISGSNGVWLPQIDMAYVRILDQDENDTPVVFSGDLSPAQQLALQRFALINDEEDDAYFRLGLGLVGQWAHGRSGFISLTRNFSDDRYDLTELTLGFRLEY